MKATPTRYSGVNFRSTLEADWAFNLDLLGIHWSYEPVALALDGVNYLPDFWLPSIRTWLEVKGPGVPGAEKVDALRAHLFDEEECWSPTTYVILGQAPTNGRMRFQVSHSADPDAWSCHGSLAECKMCRGRWFLDSTASFQCRRCLAGDGDNLLASVYGSGQYWWTQNQWQPAA